MRSFVSLGCWWEECREWELISALDAVSALAASAGMFEALAGVDAAHSKVVQREYEAANDLAAKFFKRVAVSAVPMSQRKKG